jgi:putative ABC transport system substrate-binding protein
MKRREFIAGLGSAAAWSVVAWAQPTERMRRIGMLFFGGEDEPTYRSRVATFKDALNHLGWIEGRNVQLEVRFAGGNPERFGAHAGELVSFAPDVIVTQSGASTRAVQALTKTIPIVFVEVGDPTAGGLVRSVARPEGNSTGVSNQPATISGKWLELLREAAPRITRVMLLVNRGLVDGARPYLPAIEAAAKAHGVEARPFFYRDVEDIERAIKEFGVEPNGGVIVVPPTPTEADEVVMKRVLGEQRLPAVYQSKLFVEAGGGLLSYGPDILDLFRGAASYADRILKGAKPGDLPVQFSTRFELVVNLKIAKSLGLTIPETLLATADEVIQ